MLVTPFPASGLLADSPLRPEVWHSPGPITDLHKKPDAVVLETVSWRELLDSAVFPG